MAQKRSVSAASSVPTVNTTSGILLGAIRNGVMSFKGIPFGQPPVGDLRWEPPQSFASQNTIDATTLSPSCIQQFAFATANLIEFLFNTPPPPSESEDCLFLNVFAPANLTSLKPVLFWIYGGSLAFGTASIPLYDGSSFVQNQDIVVVTSNYRVNAFGFPGGEELFPNNENLGFMDQDLALQWVQNNIKGFGGDPQKVTIVGQSAGSQSVAQAIQRHGQNTPFRAAIMQSGAATSMLSTPSFTSFDTMARAVNCTQSPGATRLACLKAVPAAAIRAWENGPQGLAFEPIVDNVTVFTDPIQRILLKQTARVPILNGADQDDGTLFTLGETSLPEFINTTFGSLISANEVRAVYPGQNDTEIIPLAFRDLVFNCPAELTTSAFVQSGELNVFRYMYGAVFADLQLFPGAGAWHSSEVGLIFGTHNFSTSTPAEITLSHTLQTVWANFIKNPTESPAPNWKRFIPGNNTDTLAKLAFQGNVQLNNVVQLAPAGLDDGPCDKLWNVFLDF
ncbi:alpha/beta-hydrolase [Ramaria rubella]|nr:alpha/beta-hydrolase [Ramaria rubella]